jgi:glycosyltransferase involved in cell wall biosynthesis
MHVLTDSDGPILDGWIGKRYLARKLSRLFYGILSPMRFDIIVSTLPLADEVVQLAGIHNAWHRIANTLSAEIAALQSRFKAARRIARYRRLYEGRRLIAVSHGVAQDLRKQMGFVDAEIATIYSPFDFDEIRAQASAFEPDLPQEPYLVHAGRFVPQKRHDLLLDAFKAASLPHRLVLLTAPSPRLTELIMSRGLQQQVTVAGFRANPFPWYANSSALLLSSDR